ncbi:oxygenase MpaB family protein [Streptomyces aurantiacus]|uniref:Putative Latex clearing protein n=1 Tax=Streptomyces aurantiacus JA 4570 TaxID=1286094 RepID=S3ZHR1_9ACTN|nr:oxygenase MpaB family protein [Streptomyces aurantiacus]EPH43136.1 putative Latex clearing protein [Streptomyces aurantiacus JA 4570]
MDELSRRKMLLTGGALGALGALGLASPAGARSAWNWAASGSVAGSGAGTDPQWVWDDEADQLLGAILRRGDVPKVNELLRTWTRNDQPLPAGLPQDLRQFMDKARRLPPWADQKKLDTAALFNKTKGIYVGALYGLGSGLMSTAIPREARAVYYSKGGADMKDRIAKTAKLGYDVGDLDAFQPQGSMIVTAVRTRLVHAAVRNLLPKSPGWTDTSGGQKIPISQADVMVTWHSLATFVMRKLNDWKVPVSRAESDAYLHVWQVTAHMLGVRDEYIPATWEAADAQSRQLLDPVLGRTDEGVKLTEVLLDIVAELDAGVTRPLVSAFSRYTLGDRIGDMIGLSREPFWQPLISTAWPLLVAFREKLIPLPLVPEAAWAMEEAIRKFVLLFLSEGRPIHLEIPDTNRPH